MATNDPTYAARYRAARAFADRSREQVAEALDVSAETIKRRERGKGPAPKAPERRALADYCQIPPEFMEYGFDGVDYTQAQRQAVTRLGESAAREATAAAALRDIARAPGDPDSPEAPAADVQ